MDVSKSLLNKDDTFLFKLSDIPVRLFFANKVYHYNWLKDLQGNNKQYIGAYIAGFDGNKIQEMNIAWE